MYQAHATTRQISPACWPAGLADALRNVLATLFTEMRGPGAIALLAVAVSAFWVSPVHALDCKGGAFKANPWFDSEFWLTAEPASVQECLNQGREVTETSNKGNMPLHFAATYNNDPAVMELMIKSGAPLDIGRVDNQATPLHLAAANSKNPEIVEILLSHGAVVDTKDDCQNTPLMWATEFARDRKILELLIGNGADVNARNCHGSTPLHDVAKYQTDTNFMTLLLDHGAKVDIRNKDGNTALHVAATNHISAALELLLDAGSDPGIKNLQGKTAYQLIASDSPMQGSDVFWRLHDLHHQ